MDTHESLMIRNAHQILEMSKLPPAVALGIPDKPAIKELESIVNNTATTDNQKMHAILVWMQRTS